MNENRIEEFYDKLCKLQDEYKIYIEADYNEDWDYAWDGENEYPTLADVNPYVAFVDMDGCMVAKLYYNTYSDYEKFFEVIEG